MLVHIISRPLAHASHIPRSGVTLLAESLRSAEVTVHEDFWAIPSGDVGTSASACAQEMGDWWGRQQPDVVHTIGLVATMAAVRAACGAPIVATFDERPADERAERQLADHVDAVLPLSYAERERWRGQGVPTLSSGAFPFPVPVTDLDACAQPVDGHVVTMSCGRTLDALIASMPHWSPNRLVIMARLSPDRLAQLRRTAAGLGVLARIDHRPGLRGRDRDEMWAHAALMVAGPEGSRHGGHVLEAAAHGIPSVAVAQEAHLDHVVPNTTGLLVESTSDARCLGHAVASLTGDSFGVQALGTSALVRVSTLHRPELAGSRLLSLYEQVTGAAGAEVIDEVEAAGGRAPERCALAVENLPLARQLAGWYSGRGQSREDLMQVASLGLVRAAERFDPSFGKEFHSFAIPTILGELRRHFRDHAWAVRVPRSLQETTMQVQRASEELRHSLGHDATASDLAERLGLLEEEVLLAMRADGEARSSHSLDHPVGDDESLTDLVGAVDPALDIVELRDDVRAALRRLPDREQQILLMRFYGERTQSEIAERLGISQVHVSRVLSRTLAALRDHVLDDVPLPTSWEREKDKAQAAGLPGPRRVS